MEAIMYKLILTAVFLYSTLVYSQSNSTSVKSPEFEKFLSEVNANTGNYSVQPDLSDFKSKAQSVLNSINTGSSITNLRCEKIIDLSLSSSESLQSYFEKLYKDDLDKMEEGWIENIVSEFILKKGQYGIMQWEIISHGEIKSVNSIAVLDENWNVLYDTELANLTIHTESDVYMEIENNLQGDNGSPTQISVINNDSSQTRSRTLTVSNVFGSVQLRFIATVTAIVPPYITASTNDAEYNYYTTSISCTRINETGIPPTAEPFLYFGTGGAYAALYSNAAPSTSPVTLTGGTGDRFNEGLYNISGDNGLNWSFSFDFSVDFPGGSIGITPESNISALSLGANSNSSINLENYVYNPASLRAVFFDGGSLNADNFRILTSNAAGETGKVRITSKLRAGYINQNGLPVFFSETSAGFDLPVQFIRGDHILQPSYQLTSTRYNIEIGQIDTLKAKIKNNSHAVNLNGGNISIDISSLDSKLTLLSSATLPIGSIDTSATKEFKFIVRGNTNGFVTPQVNISAMGWGWPVPGSILINNITSIDSTIDVSPLIKTLSLTAPIQGFYNSASNFMTRDTVRVYLRDTSSPYVIADSAIAYLNTSGEGIFTFSKAVNFTQYYIQTMHRNSIETWSKTPQFFINSELNYNFSTANTQAYGDNLVQVDNAPVIFAIYNGDVNRDGNIDVLDVRAIDNDAFNFVSGYNVTDVTGNNTTDAEDLAIADNNAFNFISKVTPP